MTRQGVFAESVPNRWVTGDEFIPAPKAIEFVQAYHLTDQAPASRFINALFTLFITDIENLILERHAKINAWQCLHPDDDALEERSLEITSSRMIDITAVLAELQNMVD